MRSFLALALLAVLAFSVAGCGSAKKVHAVALTPTFPDVLGGGPIAVGGRTATILNVQTGARVSCKGRFGHGASLRVPRRGASAAEGQSQLTQVTTPPQTKPSPTQQISVTHRQDGSITVSCTTQSH